MGRVRVDGKRSQMSMFPWQGLSYLCYASQSTVSGDVISGLNIDIIPQ